MTLASAVRDIEGLTRSGDLIMTMLQGSVIGTAAVVWREIQQMFCNGKLFYLDFPGNNQVSSGYDNERAQSGLLEMKTCNWRLLFNLFESFGYKITACFMKQFLAGGKHSFHQDKYYLGKGTHRWIISLCCRGKEFWMRRKNSSKEFGFAQQHGTVVCLSSLAAGLYGEWEHEARGDTEDSVVVVFDLMKKP